MKPGISTANDLASWVEALAGGRVLDGQIQQQRMASIQSTDPSNPAAAGYGWGMAKFGPMYGHTGELPPSSSGRISRQASTGTPRRQPSLGASSRRCTPGRGSQRPGVRRPAVGSAATSLIGDREAPDEPKAAGNGTVGR
ncbi:serine hydrolase [Mycobacterium marinum]|uniref:serine hydrolase n=1 Tax=Mycobacterium marinum TaxID=1781 RepID=UPI0035657974